LSKDEAKRLMSLPDIETHLMRSVCQNYFGGDGGEACHECARKPECDEILRETYSFIDHLNKKRSNAA